jgi:hypothetical protein
MSTASDLIKSSLRLIGVLASGESLPADMAADSLSTLNDMLDSWSTEKLIIPAKVREEFSLVGSTGAYTIGPSADFNTTRPLDIESAAIEVQTSTPYEVPLQILNSQQWAAIVNKDLTSEIPTRVYFEFTATTITARLWPVPTTAHKLVIYSWKALTSLATTATTITLPPGYAKALRYGLALELAPEYGKALDQAIVISATESKSNIKRANSKPVYLECDPAILGSTRGSFNILTGE